MPGLPLDLSLAALTIWTAWRALSHDELFVSIVLFIAFGLLMSLLWVRLGAEDLALAEATIGSGLTGALLLDASRALQGAGGTTDARSGPEPRWVVAGVALLTAALGGCLAMVVARLPSAPGGLTVAVAEQLGRSGVAQPVTAVLVNFRGYDTLLEMGVMLLAAVAMLATRRARDLTSTPWRPSDAPVLQWPVKLLVPVLALTAVHILLLGSHGSGGGFQAGALLAATAVLLLLAGFRSVTALRGVWLRAALAGGLAVYLTMGVVGMLAGGPFIGFPRTTSSGLILLAELGMGAAAGFALGTLFAGARPTDSTVGERASDHPGAGSER